jgi:hypothetical protein
MQRDPRDRDIAYEEMTAPTKEFEKLVVCGKLPHGASNVITRLCQLLRPRNPSPVRRDPVCSTSGHLR